MAGGGGSLISVVMPCFNAAEHLGESIRSALGQTHADVEVIVVDDGSTDGSYPLLKKLATEDRRLKVFCQENRGAGPARNRGLKEASGEYVAFLDADDYWALDCLEKLLGAVRASGGDLAYCGWQNVGLAGGRGEPFIPPDYGEGDLVGRFVGSCLWPIHAVLVRRTVVERAGGFDESLSSCMDYDLWLRISPWVRVTRVPEVLAFYRHYEGPRITSSRLRIARNHWLVQRRFLAANPEIRARLGRRPVRALTHGLLLRRGFEAYWDRDLEAARAIFRIAMCRGYGTLQQWKYMLPSLVPVRWHWALLQLAERRGGTGRCGS